MKFPAFEPICGIALNIMITAMPFEVLGDSDAMRTTVLDAFELSRFHPTCWETFPDDICRSRLLVKISKIGESETEALSDDSGHEVLPRRLESFLSHRPKIGATPNCREESFIHWIERLTSLERDAGAARFYLVPSEFNFCISLVPNFDRYVLVNSVGVIGDAEVPRSGNSRRVSLRFFLPSANFEASMSGMPEIVWRASPEVSFQVLKDYIFASYPEGEFSPVDWWNMEVYFEEGVK